MLGEIYILIDATIHDTVNRRGATLEVLETKGRTHLSTAGKVQTQRVCSDAHTEGLRTG